MYIWKSKCNEGWVRNKAVCLQNKAVGPHKSSVSAVDSGGSAIKQCVCIDKAVCLQNKAVGPHKSSVSAVDSGGSAIKQCVCKIKRWVRIKQCVCIRKRWVRNKAVCLQKKAVGPQ